MLGWIEIYMIYIYSKEKLEENKGENGKEKKREKGGKMVTTFR